MPTQQGGTKCLATDGFKVVIIDESHYLRTTGGKDKDAKTTESAVLAAKRAKRVIMLSGTPSLSRPFDLFRQVLNVKEQNMQYSGMLMSCVQARLYWRFWHQEA